MHTSAMLHDTRQQAEYMHQAGNPTNQQLMAIQNTINQLQEMRRRTEQEAVRYMAQQGYPEDPPWPGRPLRELVREEFRIQRENTAAQQQQLANQWLQQQQMQQAPPTPGPEYHMIGSSRDLMQEQYTVVDPGAMPNIMGERAYQELQQALQDPLIFPDQNTDPNQLQ